MRDPLLARAVDAARAESPSRLDPREAQRMIDVALARATPIHRRAWRYVLVAPALAGVAIAAMFLFARGTSLEPTAPTPSELLLPSGDRISSTAGAQIEVMSAELGSRSIRLDSGTALFDVRSLGPKEEFTVSTPDSTVRVTGTVFSIQVEASASVVRVYEGGVVVDRKGQLTILEAGSQLAADGSIAEVADGPLAELGLRRAEERASAFPPASKAAAADPIAAGADVPSTPPPTNSDVPKAEQRDDDATPPAPGARPHAEGSAEVSERPRRKVDSPQSAAAGQPKLPMTAPPLRRRDARKLLSEGDFEAALAIAVERRWHLIEGDALRALDRDADAAEAYERASADSDLETACTGAYLAATLHAGPLKSRSAALALLARIESRGPSCPLHERALSLTMDVARAAGNDARAQKAARAYLQHHPVGEHADRARAIVEAVAAP